MSCGNYSGGSEAVEGIDESANSLVDGVVHVTMGLDVGPVRGPAAPLGKVRVVIGGLNDSRWDVKLSHGILLCHAAHYRIAVDVGGAGGMVDAAGGEAARPAAPQVEGGACNQEEQEKEDNEP